MKRQFHFLGGLPRSGSTLLCNLFMQNPSIHATHTSGALDIMVTVRNRWEKVIEHKAHPDEPALRRVISSILQAYHASVERPVVIDKSRGWLAHIEMVEWALGHPIKIICPVRDIREVLASFEQLWRRGKHKRILAMEAGDRGFEGQTVAGRCDYWCRGDEVVGLAYNRIRDACARGFRDRILFVEFDSLTRQPQTVMDEVYDFLELGRWEHDFDHVEQSTVEDDSVYGFDGLHVVRPKVRPVETKADEILGDARHKFQNEAFFWRLL